MSLPTMSGAAVIPANPNATFDLTTPDLSNLVAIEGSGPCGPFPFGCASIAVNFMVTNNSAGSLNINLAVGVPSFLSGDPNDGFGPFIFSQLTDTCRFTPLAAGGSCAATVTYFTGTPVIEDGPFGVWSNTFTAFDQFSNVAHALYDITIFDPVASVPEPTSLFLFASGLLGLVMVRRRRRAANPPPSA